MNTELEDTQEWVSTQCLKRSKRWKGGKCLKSKRNEGTEKRDLRRKYDKYCRHARKIQHTQSLKNKMKAREPNNVIIIHQENLLIWNYILKEDPVYSRLINPEWQIPRHILVLFQLKRKNSHWISRQEEHMIYKGKKLYYLQIFH